MKLRIALMVLSFAACGVPQSDVCAQAAALTDADCTGGTATGAAFQSADYAEGGRCWANDQVAAACTEQCQLALDNCGGMAPMDGGT